MTNELPQGPTEWDALHPYASLTPDAVLDALADIGLMGDGRLTALSSYENRVYQIQLEAERAPEQSDGTPVPDSVVAKFYRPGRWTDAQIQEEHDFAAELVAAEVPVVPPLNLQGRTLHHKSFVGSDTNDASHHPAFQGFSFSVSERRGVVHPSWTMTKFWSGLADFWRAFTRWVLPSHFTTVQPSASTPSCKSLRIGCWPAKPFPWKSSVHGKTLGNKPWM